MNRLYKFSIALLLACIVFACKDDYVRQIPVMEVDAASAIDAPKEGSVYYATVKASEQFTATASKIWCKIEILPDATANNVRITVEPNAGVIRDCEIQLVVYSLPTIRIPVHQDGKEPEIDVPKGPQITASWQFDNVADLTEAAAGKPLKMFKDGVESAEGFTPVAGPDGGKAVRVAMGSYFLAEHGIAANGESADGALGTKVNEYTILYDYRLPALDKWYCFLQTDFTNTNDGEIFIRPSGLLTNSNIGYSDKAVPQDANWHRLVISCKSPGYCKFYIDGVLFFEGKTAALALDNRYALELTGVVLFGDEDGEDSDIDIDQVTIWDASLDDTEIAALGVAGSSGYLPIDTPTDSE